MDNKGRYKKAEREAIIEAFRAGNIGKYNPPFQIIEELFDKFAKYGSAAFGETFNNPLNPFYSKTKKLNANLAKFAVHKVMHNMQDLENASKIYGADEFEGVAKKINERYLFQWLETEYNTTTKLANSARKWSEVELDRETFPFLEYVAIVDDNSRDEHAILNGVIRPVNDAFWDEHFPPNGYNCRCTVSQVRRGEVTDLRKLPMQDIDASMNSVFKVNAGKQGQIFNGTHPYFDKRKRVFNKKQQALADDLTKKLLI